MSWKLFCLAIPILSLASAQALVEQKIDEKHPLPVVFSTASHNRISVEGGSVEKVFGDSALFSIGIDNTTGHAFINVQNEIGEKPATLTVVTSSGAVQDLIVSSGDGPSEQVVLKEEEEEKGIVVRREISHAPTVELLNQILRGKTPHGYGQRELEEVKDRLTLPAPLSATLTHAIEGPFEKIEVYEIRQNGQQPVVLSADALKNDQNSWVFLNVQEVKPEESALCVVGRLKDES